MHTILFIYILQNVILYHIQWYPSARRYSPWFDRMLLRCIRHGAAVIRLGKQVFRRFVIDVSL